MSESPYSDLERPPLSERALVRALVRPDGLWREIRVVAETGSTNADLVAAAGGGAPEGTVLVAEAQTAGRGRLGRSWQAPPRAGLTFSLLLRPAAPGARRTWLPLLTGVAVAAAVAGLTERADAGGFGEPPGGAGVVRPALKWPNDVLVGERKLGGILAENTGDAVIVGVGLNVGLRPDDLPVPAATSLAIERAAVTDRGVLLRAILREFERWYDRWRAAGGDPDRSGLRAAYREMCATLGRDVRVEMPGERVLTGTATDIDSFGRLLVRTADGAEEAVSVGDVVHVRVGA
ncbi:MAG TPA: biotin--[acetyl-CoA-carboxylase] ligase [Streptosporangiaceae bacterium]|nr:biotin--[acetyl-CoA-carboxylase] ligase [Streptosporangiaceae bacterium]